MGLGMKRKFFLMLVVGIFSSCVDTMAQSQAIQVNKDGIAFAGPFNRASGPEGSGMPLSGLSRFDQPTEAGALILPNAKPAAFVRNAALYELVGVETLDDFNRATLGPDWDTDPGFEIVDGQLSNISTLAVWDHIAVYTANSNALEVAFTYGTGAQPVPDIENTAMALMLDSPDPNANGYMIWYRPSIQSIYFYTIENGAPGQKLEHVVSALPPAQSGDEFRVVMTSDIDGHYFDCYINGTFYGQLVDPDKLQGNASDLYAGVMLHGARSNDIDNFKSVYLPGPPANLSLVGGDQQSGQVNTIANNPLGVMVTDIDGNPVAEVPVDFNITGGNPALDKSPGDGNIRVEAEIVAIELPINRYSDEDASFGEYVATTQSKKGSVTFNFEAPISGIYYVWGRVFAENAEQNSFFALMDNQPDSIVWDIAEQSFGSWNWEKLEDRVSGPVSFGLIAGAHEFKIVGREVLARLDKILITYDSGYVPSGLEPSQYSTSTDGIAEAQLTLGTEVGENRIRATSPVLPGQFVDFTAFSNTGPAANLLLLAGNNQTGNAGAPLAEPFVVRVTDEFNNSIESAPVTFEVTEGNGQFSNIQPVETDSSGRASTILTLGNLSPSNTVTATTPGVADTLIFSASAFVGVPSGLIAVSGNLQSGPAGQVLPNPFAVKAVDDFNNGIPGQSVSWVVIEGNGALQDSSTTITDSSGIALMTFSLATDSISNRVSAILAGIDTTIFIATANSGIATTIVLQSGNNQSGVVASQLASPLVVKVVDAQNTGIAGFPLTFNVTQGGGSIIEIQPVQTDSNGIALSAWSLGQASGPGKVQVVAPGLAGSPIEFNSTAEADVPAALVKVSGDSTMGEANETLASPFTVKVLDQFNNPVSSSPVLFIVTEGGGHFLNDETTMTTNTDSTGLARAFLVLGATAGVHNNQVLATKSDVSGSPITFVASTNAGGAATMLMEAGDQQTGIVRQPLTQPLSVRIMDSNDNLVAGHEVLFKVESGGGTLNGATDTVASVQSDVNGIASAQFWPGLIAGSLSHTVSASGTNGIGQPLTNSPITFRESATYTGTQIVLVSGNNQTGVVTSVLSDSLKVKILDDSDQPATNQPVTFKVVSGSGSFDNSSNSEVIKFTDSQGIAAAQFRIGTEIGQSNNVVHAIADDGFDPLQGSPVEFVASATASAAKSVVPIAGNNQTALVGTELDDILQVKVTDLGGDGIPNHPVTFQVTAGGGHFGAGPGDTLITVNSDSSGIASINWTVGDKAGQSNNRVEVISTDGLNPLQGSPLLFTASANADVSDENTSQIMATSPVTANGEAVSNITVTLRDRFDNPIPGKMVVITVNGSQNFITQPQAPTDFDGQAYGSVSSIIAEIKTITAMNITDNIQLNTVREVEFIPGPAARLNRISGNEQTGNIGTVLKDPLVVRITDNLGNPVSGVPVVFEARGGGGHLVETTMPIRSDSSGLAQVHYVLGDPVGFNVVEVWSGSLQGSPALFSAQGVTGQATKLIYASGNNQNGTAGNPLSDSLVVKALDGDDNPVKNVQVSYSVVFGGGSIEQAQPVLTDAFGMARAVFSLGSSLGQHFAKADSPGLSGSPITFFANAGSAGADSMFLISGNGQSGKVGTPGLPVRVRILDEFDNPVLGYVVRFETSQGEINFTTSQSDTTDIEGVAEASFDYGTSSGVNEIQAIGEGLKGSPAKFQVTSIPADPAAAEIFNGNSQIAYTGQSLANPLQVKITDQFGNPVSGYEVNYVIIQGDADIKGSASVSSDAQGIAAGNIILGSQPGNIAVLAVASGLSGSPLQFNAQAMMNNVPWISGANGSVLSDTTVQEKELLELQVAGGDPDGDTLTLNIEGKPEGAAFESIDASTWKFSWTPDYDQSGLHSVIFEIQDGKGGVALDTLNIMILNVNRSPVITGFSPETGPTLGESDTTIFSIEAEDPDGDPLAYFWMQNGVLVDDDPEFQFTSPVEASVEIVGYVTDGVDTVSHQWMAVVTGVELEMFAAEIAAAQSAIRIVWTTSNEGNNLGFNVHRSNRQDDGYAILNEVLIRPDPSGQYTLLDSEVEAGVRYYYKLEDVSAGGLRTLHGPVLATIDLPTEFRMAQNYPNPFNPETTIRFQLPSSGQVRLTVFNILGKQVRDLIDRQMEPGFHSVIWDARDDNGSRVTSGIYYYRISADGYSDFRKMLLMK